MPDERVEISGLEELSRRLLKLPEAMERTALEPAMQAGVDVIAELAQQNAPRKTGKLADDITTKVGSNLAARRAQGESQAVQGVVYVRKRSAAVARWNEFGTAPHTINAHGTVLEANGEIFGKTVQHPGQPARPFMRPAFDEGAEKAVEAMKRELARRLDAITAVAKGG